MTVTTGNQTLRFLKKRFEEVGIYIKSRHGQNFLIDLNLQRLIVDSAELGAFDVVLEVGTGTGALTALMAARAAAVVSVEIDPQLHQLASEELFGVDNVTLLQQDALKNKSTIDARVIEAVQSHLAAHPGRRLKLVANLPYNIATPIISNLLAWPTPPHSLTVTIQKELADRMLASPNTRDYSALSIWVQSQCRGQLVRVLPPTVFWPKPKVTSAIVRLEVDANLRSRIADTAFFHDFVRSLFLHRRKFLRGVLVSAMKGRLEKAEVDEILSSLSLAEEQRAEQLDVPAMLALSDAVQARLKQNGL